jgi:hypothetical protein
MRSGFRLKLEDRKNALTADGRGANEELGMPRPDDYMWLKNRWGGLDLDQDDHGCGHRDGRSRVHHET